ncbi:MAG TPA: 6-hydroxymethylpterin diphosphokinase MptE-like protein [Planctomycetota bacterium]|nr:6-hydroxymethylpterin diphosphokinase MptE-like protein [Planctomycetota bacterium]
MGRRKQKRKKATLGGRRIVAPPSGLGALMRDGDIHGDDFYVTRVYLGDTQLFDRHGRLATLKQRISHEFKGEPARLYVRAGDNVTYGGVRDWMSDSWNPQKFTVSEMESWRMDVWGDMLAKNRPMISKSLGDVPQSDVVWIVASGPSLEATAALVPKIRRGVKIAVNWTLGWFQDAGYGTDLFDYFMCVDYKFHMMDRHGPFPKTTAVLDVTANHKVAAMAWADRRWFLSCGGMDSDIYRGVKAEHPDMAYVDPGLSVTFAAIQFASKHLRAKTIVLVGADCALTFGRVHPGQPATYNYENPACYVVLPDVMGAPAITVDIYRFIATWTEGCGYWLKRHGIRGVNATQAGLVRKHWEIRNLDEVIEELNKE